MRRRAVLLGLLVAACAGCGSSAHVDRNVNVSNAVGRQAWADIAVDPRNPDVLLAGSVSFPDPLARIYSSTDGGTSWSSKSGPPAPKRGWCLADGPSVAIDGKGRQYYAFASTACPWIGFSGEILAVAHRAGPGTRWTIVHMPLPVWDRNGTVVLSGSRDGRRWSPPVRVNHKREGDAWPSIAGRTRRRRGVAD